MTLQSTYKQFLAAPKAALLSENASLHYITTLVTVNGAAEIIKHLSAQSHALEKKEEKFLDVVEGANAIAVEVHTIMEFTTGGGSYLPGLDDNFLADRTVNFPIIHIVSFDPEGKIQQIRQSWDQGSLLKLIDVIGKTGRNWPIRDGKDQIKLIASSVKSSGKPSEDAQSDTSSDYARSRGNSTNVTRDPHASLSLFQPRQNHMQESLPAVAAPRASSKPPQRDYHDLFVEQEHSPEAERSESPIRPGARAGAAKNYAPSRLFDVEESDIVSPEKKHSAYIPNPARYQHFDFADPDSEEMKTNQKPLVKGQSVKHSSQWNFDDFNTPQKVVPSKVLRTNDTRHWGNSDDEVADSPMKFKKVDKPRKDAETHFEFQDDGTPANPRRVVGRPRGAGQNSGLGLYKDNMFEEGTESEVAGYKPILANTKDRRKDFDPHFEMTDDSPASKPVVEKITENRAKAVKMMDANWDTYDQSPNQKENAVTSPTTASRPSTGKPLAEATNTMSQNKGIAIAGDGMGGKKGVTGTATKKAGIAVGGDGMGGKKGTGRSWGFGDDSDGEEAGGNNVQGKYRTGKTGGKSQQATGGDFWDF